ncbi:hypothetical protein QBC37DRAFT_313170 [Rhypophila decipiens]|uniref:Uncharacterized protein n=1 Tax=Rhypophila decipiens TaxID=261697 RepID=A0AAN7B931_9PEZI|nr:hypothetical protein QBC37DRAFT_313170 [Rhypophila decipiens]
MGLHRLAVPTRPSMESELLRSSESPSPVRRVTNTLTRRGHSWIVEIIALLISVGALAAICIILPLYDGRPLDAWSFVLSLNTVVSILGATSRASMGFALSAAFGQEKWNWYRDRDDKLLTFDRFDEATRGPFGSLKLLWHLKFKHWTALGALAMAVLLGFEPFLQALIELEGQPNSVTPGQVSGLGAATQQPATISRSAGTLDMGRYIGNGSTAADYAASLLTAQYFSRPDFGLTAAIIAGLSSSNATNNAWNPSFSCSSGNCTWAPFTSLGVCSQCNDVSDNIRSSTGIGGLHPGYDELNYTSHSLSTPGANLVLSNWHISYAGKQCPLCETATLVADTNLSPELTLTFQDMTSMIISWVYMAADTSYSEGKTKWKDTPVTAHECSLYFCTQALKSRVEKGQLFEQVLGTWARRRSFVSQDNEIVTELVAETHGRFSNASFLPWLLSATGRTFGADMGINNSTMQLYIPRSELTDANITGIADEDLEFNITRATMGALMRYLAMDLSGLNSRYYNNNSNLTSWNTQLIYPPDFYGNTLMNGPTPPLINSLGEAANVTAVMESMAASMTKFLRDRSDSVAAGNSFPARRRVQIGETQLWVIHIRVRWAYLALPAAVLLLGCAVVLAVILRSRRLGLPAWRGSALVTLARGLDPTSRERLRAADCAGDLRRDGREMRVALLDGDSMGPQLTEVGSQSYEDFRRRLAESSDVDLKMPSI